MISLQSPILRVPAQVVSTAQVNYCMSVGSPDLKRAASNDSAVSLYESANQL